MAETEGTDCTPGYCTYGIGHACEVVTRYPERFPPGGRWTYAWRQGTHDRAR